MGLFSMVTWGLGLLLWKLQGTPERGGGEWEYPISRSQWGEDGSPQSPCDYEGMITCPTL